MEFEPVHAGADIQGRGPGRDAVPVAIALHVPALGHQRAHGPRHFGSRDLQDWSPFPTVPRLPHTDGKQALPGALFGSGVTASHDPRVSRRRQRGR